MRVSPAVFPAAKIDYTDIDEICGYQMLLCKIFERDGGFGINPEPSRTTAIVRREGNVWLREVDRIIRSILADDGLTALGLADIPRLIDSYDFLYRVCHGRPCLDFVRDVRLRTADRWADVDKSLSATKVALMLLKEIIRSPHTMPRRYVDFCTDVTRTWIDHLRGQSPLPSATQEDTYFALASLLRQNLTTFGVTEEEKTLWIETHTLDESAVAHLNLSILWSYIDYDTAASAFQHLPLPEQDARYHRLLTHLSHHPHTNRFTRQAIEAMNNE